MTKENPKKLSQYDDWLLGMSRQKNDFIFHRDMVNYLFQWLLKNRFKRTFSTYKKEADDDVYADMLNAFKRACFCKSRDNIISQFNGLIHDFHNKIDDDGWDDDDDGKEKEPVEISTEINQGIREGLENARAG